MKAFRVLSHLILTMPHRASSYHYVTLEAWRLGLRWYVQVLIPLEFKQAVRSQSPCSSWSWWRQVVETVCWHWTVPRLDSASLPSYQRVKGKASSWGDVLQTPRSALCVFQRTIWQISPPFLMLWLGGEGKTERNKNAIFLSLQVTKEKILWKLRSRWFRAKINKFEVWD